MPKLNHIRRTFSAMLFLEVLVAYMCGAIGNYFVALAHHTSIHIAVITTALVALASLEGLMVLIYLAIVLACRITGRA